MSRGDRREKGAPADAVEGLMPSSGVPNLFEHGATIGSLTEHGGHSHKMTLTKWLLQEPATKLLLQLTFSYTEKILVLWWQLLLKPFFFFFKKCEQPIKSLMANQRTCWAKFHLALATFSKTLGGYHVGDPWLRCCRRCSLPCLGIPDIVSRHTHWNYLPHCSTSYW